jgi:hypothetical protein
VAPIFADTAAASTYTTTAVAGSPADQIPACAPTPTPALASFALCSLGDMAVLTRSGSSATAIPVGSALAAVIISHGKNGYGAWQTNGTRMLPLPQALNDDEASNVNGTTPVPVGNGIGYLQYAFFSRDPTPPTCGCSDAAPGTAGTGPLCEFDDIVAWISTPVLISRMVSAGRLP